MIVQMKKVFVVAAASDRIALLDRLAEIGVMHLMPVDPARAKPDEQTVNAKDAARRALQTLAAVIPAGQAPQISPAAAVTETIELSRRSAEQANRLSMLHRQVEQLADWGDVRLEQFHALAAAGVPLRFFSIPRQLLGEVQAELVQELADQPGKRVLVAVVSRDAALQVPPGAIEVSLPARDRPTIRAEAATLDAAIKADAARLGQLAHLSKPIAQYLARLEEEASFAVADRGALVSDSLFAVQGWVPAQRVDAIAPTLAELGIKAAVEATDPDETDTPPTLLCPPRWARPILGLMKVLGLSPGYRENDVSVAFMIALPLFAAMLFSDAGYGLLFVVLPLLLYRKAAAALGKHFTDLIIVIGGASVVWGVLTGSFFGMDLAVMIFHRPPPIAVSLKDEDMKFLMRLSFTIGVIHLSLAQLWRAVLLYPSLTYLCKVGWSIFLWGMYGAVLYFVLGGAINWQTAYPYLLIAGGVLAIGFAAPSRNIFKTIALGLANFPLSMLGTFSDIMSYVRLMAVGLAGSILAMSFNELAVGAGPILMVPILIFGHGLNIGLCMIALFAHGVRLNVLEFSNNFGMEWSGHPYQPFERKTA
ncbi:MAG: hypothetical protein LLG03_08250 [Planctomycetaceae bacterium]|nr:hypothetical protein [Planctomycetaceae bacterium]